MSQPVFAACYFADIASEYQLSLAQDTSFITKEFRLKNLRKNIREGCFTSSEPYTQNLVQIVELNPPKLKLPSRFFEVLTVVCDDTNISRISLKLPEIILNNGFCFLGRWDCNGEIKEDKSFVADCSISYEYPSKTLPIEISTFMHSATLTATPVK